MACRPVIVVVLALAVAACSNSSSPQPGKTADGSGSAREIVPIVPPVRAGGDPAAAVGSGSTDPHAGPRGFRDRTKQFDTDGDGQLSDAERLEMMAARSARVMAKFDADGDGQMTRAEFAGSPMARRIDDFAVADTDRNGTLSTTEIGRAMADQMRKTGGARG